MAGAGAGEADGVACPAVMGSTTHQELTLELTADVAEWCPLPSHRRLLAAGTYQLDEATQQRHGRLHLYQLRGDLEAAVPAVAPLHLHPCGTLDLPGIFDLRWRPGGDAPALAAALADGSVRLLEMEVGGGTQEGYVAAEVSEVARSPARDGSMALSLDFSPAGGGGGGSVISSFSCGTLRHFQVREPSVSVPYT
jgi:diphthamide biosynthesis protein 7